MTRWNPYIDLHVAVSRAPRAQCVACNGPIDRGTHRVEAIPVVGKPALLHVDCACKKAPDHCRRKVKERDPDWPAEVLDELDRRVPKDVEPAPRSFLRTPLLDLSWDKDPSGGKPCVYCGEPCPGAGGPEVAHAVRAFSLDAERRFHPKCVAELAPGLCRRVVVEASERWPADLRAWFAAAVPAQIAPTPRSPWRNTAGIPRLEPAPSARAACKYCAGKIDKGAPRLAREQVFGMRRSPAFFHVRCLGRSDDWHPKLLELAVLKCADDLDQAAFEQALLELPPPAPEDDDVTPLPDRLRALYALAVRARQAKKPEAPRPTENEVDIPDGFFLGG